MVVAEQVVSYLLEHSRVGRRGVVVEQVESYLFGHSGVEEEGLVLMGKVGNRGDGVEVEVQVWQ